MAELTDSTHKPVSCSACMVNFCPKTPIITWGGYDYHHGCFEAMRQRGQVIVDHGPKELLFMRDLRPDQIHEGIITFKVRHD